MRERIWSAVFTRRNLILTMALVATGAFLLFGPALKGGMARSAPIHDQGQGSLAAGRLLDRVREALEREGATAEQKVEEALGLIVGAKKDSKEGVKESKGSAKADPFDDYSLFSSPFSSDDWEPFREMSRMRRHMNRLFDDAFMRMGDSNSLDSMFGNSVWAPRGEAELKDGFYVYRFDLPGVEKGDVSVTLRQGKLIIEGSRNSSSQDANGDNSLVARETCYGKFSRMLTLPGDADVQGNIQSSLDNGVLTVRVPRIAAASSGQGQGRTVEVK